MNAIVKEFIDNEKFKDCLGNIDKKISPINLLGLTDVAKTLSLAATKESSKRTICLITYNEIQAKKLLDDLKYFNSKTVYFPKKDIVTYDYIAESKDLPYERIEVLNRIYNGSVDIVVTTIEACMQKMISPKELYSNVIKFEFNKEYKFDEIKEKLVKLGYERTELIEGKGQFSVRGDIIDIAVTNNKGVRVEFWGDEIDSIRYFNISSQRSIEELNEITIYPAHEYIVTDSIENIVNKVIIVDDAGNKIGEKRNDKSIELYSSHNTYFNRALAKENIENYKGSIADYNKAIELNPNDYQIYKKRAYSKYKIDDYKGAIADYNKTLELHPNDFESIISLGILELELEQYQEAYDTFTSAIKIDAEFPDIYLNRAIAECALCRFDEALQDIEKLFGFNNVFKNDYISLFNKLSEILEDLSENQKSNEKAQNFAKRLENYKSIVNDTDFRKEFKK